MTQKDVPMNTHKIAHNTPSKEKQRIPLLDLLALLEVAPAATFMFMAFNLNRLKLDIRSKALLTKALSAAEAGVVGIDSTKAHREEDKLEFVASSCLAVWIGFAPAG